MNSNNIFTSGCPIPINDYPRVLLAHGGGGKLMHNLIEKMFISTFGDSRDVSCDAAVSESKGKGDGIFINTSGIGIIEHDLNVHPLNVKEGDIVIVNGDLGRHGITIMAQREGLSFESNIESDSAPLNGIVKKLIDAKIKIHCMRDLTRGGLASALNEISESAQVGVQIDEKNIPVHPQVQGACEILGFDPIYVANEGRFVLFIDPSDLENTIKIMKEDFPETVAIGEVSKDNPGIVCIKSKIGVDRIVDMISGEQLPRIC